MEHTLYVIGIGPGHPDYMVPLGHKIIEKVNVLVGSARALEDFALEGQKTFPVTGKLKEMAQFVEDHLAHEDVAVLVSGDTGYYSLLQYLKRTFPEVRIEVIAGISSMTFAFARLQESWYDADLLSFHGRVPSDESLVYKEGRKLGFLTDKENNPAQIARILMEKGWPSTTRAAALERLSYDDERIVDSTLEEISTLDGFFHSVMVVIG